MFQFILLTLALLIGLGAIFSVARRKEIIANWDQYRTNPIFMFSAFLYKPDSDPRSRFQFTADNFREVIGSLVTGLFEVVLAPFFSLLKTIANNIEQVLRGFISMRTVFGTMWNKFMDMTAIFESRFAMVLHQLRIVMFRIFTSFQRVTGVATSAVFSGLSAVYSMLNFIDLIIKVIIVILVVMVVLVFFFFFILAPFIPIILVVVGIITTTAMAGAVGGMAGKFCFAENTLVPTARGDIPISKIKVGDCLADGSSVTATMQFQAPTEMYDLNGVIVSGDHLVFDEKGDILHVKYHSNAFPVSYKGSYVHCLNTTSHKISIGDTVFSDWEEISGDDNQKQWNIFVFETLNQIPWSPPNINSQNLKSESCLAETVHVLTPSGPRPISTLRPGMMVLDANGTPTQVTGCIQIASSEVKALTEEGISVGAWIRRTPGGAWMQPQQSQQTSASLSFVSLTTIHGTFLLECGIAVRDFTDVGADEISRSYVWVLDALSGRSSDSVCG